MNTKNQKRKKDEINTGENLTKEQWKELALESAEHLIKVAIIYLLFTLLKKKDSK